MTDENANNEDREATTEELASLIKAQAERISELEADAATHAQLKDEVTRLQDTLGTTTSLSELIEQLKTLNEATGKRVPTEEERTMTELQKAAEAGDMKKYRKLRKAQQA